MPTIYLSPSTQEGNPYFTGSGSEEYWNNLEQMLRSLKKMGLKGMECFYPEHTEEEQLKFAVLAGKYHLHMTEGSDFHGDE